MTNEEVRQSPIAEDIQNIADRADLDQALRIYRMCLAGLEDAVSAAPELQALTIGTAVGLSIGGVLGHFL